VNFQPVHWMNKGPGVLADGPPPTSELPHTRNTLRASHSNARRKRSAVSRGHSSRGHTVIRSKLAGDNISSVSTMVPSRSNSALGGSVMVF